MLAKSGIHYPSVYKVSKLVITWKQNFHHTIKVMELKKLTFFKAKIRNAKTVFSSSNIYNLK